MALQFLKKLFPNEFNFYDLFEKQVGFAVEAARRFKEIVARGSINEESIKTMETLEHEADDVAHTILSQLDQTFITPFDREDIHALTNELDNVTDLLDTIISRMKIYRISGVNKELVQFADVIEAAIHALDRAIKGMRDVKNRDAVMEDIVEVHRLENVSDAMRDDVLGNLFETEKDAIAVIKWKEIYQDAEKVLDQCEDVAHIVQSILLKQA